MYFFCGMDLEQLQQNWDAFGRQDPLWAVLTTEGKQGGAWDPKEFFANGQQQIRRQMELFRVLDIDLTPDRALDFGCGVGRITQALAGQFKEVWGVDVAPSMIERAKEFNRFPDSCHYLANESADLRAFDSDTFDLVFCCLVLQHMKPEYAREYMTEFVRILKPGGVGLVQIPSERDPTDAGPVIPDPCFQAVLGTRDAMPPLQAGHKHLLRVRVQNNGTVAWRQGGLPFNVGNHWLNQEGQVVHLDDGRSPVGSSLAPGEVVEVNLQVTAPPEPGDYLLELDIVHEDVAWFADWGSPTYREPVTVTGESQQDQAPQADLGPAKATGSGTASGSEPRMEMYAIPQDEVVDCFTTAGAAVLRIEPDRLAPGYKSYTYYVRGA